jgi:hypothetical protein
MANQSDPKAGAFIILQALIPALLEASNQYLKDMEAGGYARNSVSTARQEIDGFLHWFAGKRKVHPRQRTSEAVARLTELINTADTLIDPPDAAAS